MAIIEEHRRMKTDVQSFNKALNIIWASSPTGCTEKEKIAMALSTSNTPRRWTTITGTST
jgi:hypothetical protein